VDLYIVKKVVKKCVHSLS